MTQPHSAGQGQHPLITPVLLCGGSGTRLWPLSRKSFPKQFVPLLGSESLFQNSVARLCGPTFARPIIVTGSDFRFIVTEQLDDIGVEAEAILIEPEARNTAPAVLAAALQALAQDPDSILLVAPTDHEIDDVAGFRQAVSQGLAAVAEGKIVTFGITPDRPETGYGYLELGEATVPSAGHIALKRFVEKPDRDRAVQMIESGRFLWNAGIFLFSARDMVAAFETLAPEFLAPVRAALAEAQPDLGFLRLAGSHWSGAPAISIDYAIMERSDALAVVPITGGWSDLGNWDSVWQRSEGDASGVVRSGAATSIDCQDSLLRSDSDSVQLVGIGLKNIMAIAMNDAVLVADMSRAQDVKQAVEILKAQQVPQATQFPKDHRPWGWFETLVLAPRFQVKRIHVNPGAALSLQSHHHRSEHWIVVHGTARVTVDDKVSLLSENQSVYVPLGSVHRMENPGKVPMVLIEVQTGSYLGEDDIIRFDDRYARGEGAKG